MIAADGVNSVANGHIGRVPESKYSGYLAARIGFPGDSISPTAMLELESPFSNVDSHHVPLTFLRQHICDLTQPYIAWDFTYKVNVRRCPFFPRLSFFPISFEGKVIILTTCLRTFAPKQSGPSSLALKRWHISGKDTLMGSRNCETYSPFARQYYQLDSQLPQSASTR